MSRSTMTTVHHLYGRSGDLLPSCGAVPGSDGAEWHTGHDVTLLLALASAGEACCSLCLVVARSAS